MMLWQNLVNALIGIWFIMSPFALSYTHAPARMVTSFIGGIILLLLGGTATLSERARREPWIQYANGLVGVWFIIAPSALSFAGKPADHWTSLIGGVVVLVLSASLLLVLGKRATALESR